MKRLVALLLTIALCPSSAIGHDMAVFEPVKRIIDGDTIELGSGERIRLIGVSAAERGRCGHDTATQQLAAVVNEGVLVVRTGKDKYGRTLAYLYTTGRKARGVSLRLERNSINIYLILSGYAKADHQHSHAYSKSYYAAERTAKAMQFGIWNRLNCPPAVLP